MRVARLEVGTEAWRKSQLDGDGEERLILKNILKDLLARFQRVTQHTGRN